MFVTAYPWSIWRIFCLEAEYIIFRVLKLPSTYNLTGSTVSNKAD